MMPVVAGSINQTPTKGVQVFRALYINYVIRS